MSSPSTTPSTRPSKTAPKPQPRRFKGPTPRLASLGRTPAQFVPSPSPAPQGRRNVCPRDPKHPLDEDDGALFCTICAITVSEVNPYVSDVTWVETAGGTSRMEGQFVGADQTHARTTAVMPGGRTARIRGDGQSNIQRTKNEAAAIIHGFALRLGLPDRAASQGINFFSLAQHHNFLAGRGLTAVAACCLYVACRIQPAPRDPLNPPPEASVMLIDFAQIIGMNVFWLGQTYTKMVQTIWGTTEGIIFDQNRKDDVGKFTVMPPEMLVDKFVRQLEFDPRDQNRVKLDAVNVIKRMKRDWMHYGRRPAGICGAAVILAARMNNYRRTVREVVLVAKVTEVTIGKRLEEFKLTEAGTVTVDKFRDDQVRDSLADADPPAYSNGLVPRQKKKRGRPRKRPLPETAAEFEENDDDEEGPRSRKRVRFDKDGFRIPDIPVRASAVSSASPQIENERNGQNQPDTASHTVPPETTSAHRGLDTLPNADPEEHQQYGRGRRRRSNRRILPASEEEIEHEGQIAHDLQWALVEGRKLLGGEAQDEDDNYTPDSPHDESTSPRARSTSLHPTDDTADDPSQDTANNPSAPIVQAWSLTPELRGPPVDTGLGNSGLSCSMSPTLSATEFDSDPDVSSCLLSAIESRIKERIWVEENKDWLRKDTVKRIEKELKIKRAKEQGLEVDANGNIVHADKGRGRGRRKRRRPGRIGDVSYLDESSSDEDARAVRREASVASSSVDGESVVDGETREERRARRRRERSATDAMKKVLNHRAPSRRVNYHSLQSIYGVGSSSSNPSQASPSPAPSGRSRIPSYSPAPSVVSSTVSEVESAPALQGRNSQQAVLITPPTTQLSPRAAAPTLSKATTAQAATSPAPAESRAAHNDELLGSIDEDDDFSSELSSLPLSQNTSQTGGDGDRDESGSEGDYVDEDDAIEAAFGGRT